MQISMTISNMAALFGALFVLALIPTISGLAVSTRSAAFGFIHGAFTAIGIVAGDVIFILIAIFGLSILADSMGNLFVLVKYLGGAYLIWLGLDLWGLWRSKPKAVEAEELAEASLLSSFLTGLLITLADQKAIFFYLGFFPAFFDLSAISYFDTSIILAIAIIAVGGAKLVYAFTADRASVLISPKAHQKINIVAGSVIIAVGVFLIANT